MKLREEKQLSWQKKLEATEKNAIKLLGECFRIGGLSFVRTSDLRPSEGTEKFVKLMNWMDFTSADCKCIITAIGLDELRRVRKYFD